MNNKLQNRFYKFINKTNENPIITSFFVLIIVSGIVIGLSIPYYLNDFNDFYQQILAEAHGMLFDIAVIGILILWLHNHGENRRRIRTYLDEIDDFRLWDSEEAAYRTAGNIKRLNRHGIHDLNLADCYLARTNLNYVNLSRANLNLANLSHAHLIGSFLVESRLNQTNFEQANLNHCDLQKAYANGANFNSAFLINANFENSYLIKANFENAILMEANLQGCDLSGASFKFANLFKADLRRVTGLTCDQLLEARNLHRAKLDDQLFQELQAKRPELLAK
ncbi:MAG: pentapeptide repeat-containing protein [Microscillaceae bacterium]|nr:pentapeptide repeat-containing protein [Microscillaceae bacterium]